MAEYIISANDVLGLSDSSLFEFEDLTEKISNTLSFNSIVITNNKISNLNQAISFSQVANINPKNLKANNRLEFNNKIGRPIELYANSSLGLSQQGAKSNYQSSDNRFSFDQNLDYSRGFNQVLLLTDIGTFNIVKVISNENSLDLNSAVSFYKEGNIDFINVPIKPINGNYVYHYNSDPVTVVVDTITPPNNIQLIFESSRVLESKTLEIKPPELSDSEALEKTRINRKTRGGNLKIARDKQWTAIERLKYNFRNRSQTESKDILDFSRKSIGKEIKLIDYNNNIWQGIISNIPLTITQESRETFTYDIEFEVLFVGVRVVLYQTDVMHFLHTVSLASSIFNRDLDSTISFSQTLSRGGTLNAVAANTITFIGLADSDVLSTIFANTSNTLTLNHSVSVNIVSNRSLTGSLTLITNASANQVFNHSLNNSLVLVPTTATQNILNISVSSTFLGQSLTIQLVDLEDLNHSIIFDQSLTCLTILNIQTSNSLTFTQQLDYDITRNLTVENTLTLTGQVFIHDFAINQNFIIDHEVFVNIVSNQSVENSLIFTDQADFGFIYTEETDNTLTLSGVATTQNTLNIIASNTLTFSGVATTQNTLNIIASNTLTFSGVTTTQNILNIIASNTLTLSGVATTQNILNIIASNTLALSGQVFYSLTINANNTLALSGVTTTQNILNISTNNTLTLFGAATTENILNITTSNTLIFNNTVVAIYERSLEDTINFDQIVQNIGVYNLSPDNTITIIHNGICAIVDVEELTSTLVFIGSANQNQVFNRSLESVLALNHNVSYLAVFNLSPNNTLTLSGSSSVNIIDEQILSSTITFVSSGSVTLTSNVSGSNTLTFSGDASPTQIFNRNSSSTETFIGTVSLLGIYNLSPTGSLTFTGNVSSLYGKVLFNYLSRVNIFEYASMATPVNNKSVSSTLSFSQSVSVLPSVYSTPGTYTWTVPSTRTGVIFEAWGAGGSGYSGNVDPGSGGGGGAGGGYGKSTRNVTAGDIIYLVIGSKGFLYSINGGDSGAYFSTDPDLLNTSILLAKGGPGATDQNGATAATSGQYIADVVHIGGNGGASHSSSGGGGGGSGGSAAAGNNGSNGGSGAGGAGGTAVTNGGPGASGSTTLATPPSTGPGGGGGGSKDGDAGHWLADTSAGADGKIKITY